MALPASARLLFNMLCDFFVVLGNFQHNSFRFAVPHAFSDGAHLFSAKTPKFWIFQVAGGRAGMTTLRKNFIQWNFRMSTNRGKADVGHRAPSSPLSETCGR